ncbi:MAG: hypothetical protein JSV02_10210 [Dehalococcoidia bacterium]|nr:MAG: hypothetical protein JSV02_10210 [Dehalococcoidia bacterium]
MTNEIVQDETGEITPYDVETETDSNILDEDLKERVRRLEESLASKDNELASLKGALANAVDKYRTAVLATDPGVPAELLKGETVEDIDDSLEQARRIVLQVRQQLDNDAAAKSIPAGAPPWKPSLSLTLKCGIVSSLPIPTL